MLFRVNAFGIGGSDLFRSQNVAFVVVLLFAGFPAWCIAAVDSNESWPPKYVHEMLMEYRDFLFPQARELVFHLITLSSALLALTLTFAGQFIKNASRLVRVCVAGCWLSLILSLATAGIGLLDISRAAVTCAKGIASIEADVKDVQYAIRPNQPG